MPTVGIELSVFKRAKIKNRQTSQQKSQQQRGDKKSAPCFCHFLVASNSECVNSSYWNYLFVIYNVAINFSESSRC